MRILIVRDDNIGDALLFAGALSVLREHWPEAHITLVLRRHVAEMFEHCPFIDRVLPYERLALWERLQARRVRGAWALEGVLRRFSRIRMGRFDRILCPVSAPREELVSVIDTLCADEKLGFSGYMLQYPEGELPQLDPEKVFSRTVTCSRDERWYHEFERLRAFLQLCGCSELSLPLPRLWLADRDYEFAARMLPNGQEYVGAFLGASSHWRRWPVAHWCELLAAVAQGRQIVLLGGDDASQDARQIAKTLAMGGLVVHRLCARTSLCELAASIDRCQFIVSTESAGLHFAIAQDVPSVGITGQHHMGRYVPWGDPERHRIASIPCDRSEECTGACFYEDYRCIQNIPVEVVQREVDALQAVITS